MFAPGKEALSKLQFINNTSLVNDVINRNLFVEMKKVKTVIITDT